MVQNVGHRDSFGDVSSSLDAGLLPSKTCCIGLVDPETWSALCSLMSLAEALQFFGSTSGLLRG